MTKEEILQQCTVSGNIVKLPEGKLDGKLYKEIALSFKKIGGKWTGGKTMGFVFEQDPTDLLSDIASGEKRNIKKEFQFYGTNDKLADDLVFEAQIEPSHDILEPSAGDGALIKAIHRVFPDPIVDFCELMELNRLKTEKLPNVNKVGVDFLNMKTYCKKKYDRIIANPPFANNQDITHIMEMYQFLKKGGRLVSVASTHWEKSKNKKETEFRDWLKKVKADIGEITDGSFKKSGTGVRTCMIIINK